MNHYDAREILFDGKPSGRYHYTCQNDGLIWPVGYCREHTVGHTTREDAYECYKKYCLDTRLRLDGEWQAAQYPCEVCKQWTSRFAEVGHRTFNLCDTHRTREQVEKLFSVGYVISSY